jgi:hypothetical protein
MSGNDDDALEVEMMVTTIRQGSIVLFLQMRRVSW